jgi:hypothetical protein
MPKKGYKQTPLHKLNLSKALLSVPKPNAVKIKISAAMRNHPVSKSTRLKLSALCKLKNSLARGFAYHISKVHPESDIRIKGNRLYKICIYCDATIKPRKPTSKNK